jgi:hypothetical protein
MIGDRVAALQAQPEHEESGDTDQGDERDRRELKLDQEHASQLGRRWRARGPRASRSGSAAAATALVAEVELDQEHPATDMTAAAIAGASTRSTARSSAWWNAGELGRGGDLSRVR